MVIPINYSLHWSLAVIVRPSKILSMAGVQPKEDLMLAMSGGIKGKREGKGEGKGEGEGEAKGGKEEGEEAGNVTGLSLEDKQRGGSESKESCRCL